MSEAQTVTATFTAKPIIYSLAISKIGSGSVKSDPTGINCGSDCVGDFTSGSKVILTATPASGYEFSGWSGACSGSGNCTVSMSKIQTVTATFIPTSYQLSVSTANGTVSSAPAGINCGSNCTASDELEDRNNQTGIGYTVK